MIKNFVSRFKLSPQVWMLIVLVSASWAYLLFVLNFSNVNGYYPIDKLQKIVLFIPAVFFILVLLVGTRLFGKAREFTRKELLSILLLSGFLATVLLLRLSIPLPGLPQEHSLKIIVRSGKNISSQGTSVIIQKLQHLDGHRIPWENLTMSGDWHVVDDELVSNGEPGSTIEIMDTFMGGVLLSLIHSDNAGQITIIWDGVSSDSDLFSKESSIVNTYFQNPIFDQQNPSQILWIGIALLFFIVGVLSLIFIVLLVIRILAGQNGGKYLLLVSCLVVFAVFLEIKLSYAKFESEITFRDTYAYVKTAELPLSSISFWAAERSFTLPLFYKLLSVNTTNFEFPDTMNKIALAQTILSIFSWVLLGVALALSLRHRWLGLLSFTLVLFFSLNMEVSLWDHLLLSESISFSFMAMLIAAWIGWVNLSYSNLRRRWIWAYTFTMIAISFLYSFTRDSNQYFVLLGSAVFAVGYWLKKINNQFRYPILVYIAACLGLFIIQNWSINQGNRWQVLIYDQLAMRILNDPQATQFFKDAGLPVSDELMKITGMRGYDYQNLLKFDPSMSSVREWIDTQGKAVYIRYLLSHPVDSILRPLKQIHQLLNGSNLKYREPEYSASPMSKQAIALTNGFYPHQRIILVLILILILLGQVFYWVQKRPQQPTWLVVTILLISLYPMMFIIWHGNPMEIERHAAQIGIQFRLAGVMAIPMLLNEITRVLKIR
jgi:hypothetical protein